MPVRHHNWSSRSFLEPSKDPRVAAGGSLSGVLEPKCQGLTKAPVKISLLECLFCIGRSEFVFHLDGELNRDG